MTIKDFRIVYVAFHDQLGPSKQWRLPPKSGATVIAKKARYSVPAVRSSIVLLWSSIDDVEVGLRHKEICAEDTATYFTAVRTVADCLLNG